MTDLHCQDTSAGHMGTTMQNILFAIFPATYEVSLEFNYDENCGNSKSPVRIDLQTEC